MAVRGWALNPDAGGVTIPVAIKQETKTRLIKHAAKHYFPAKGA